MITQFSMCPEPQNIVYFKDSQLQIDEDFTITSPQDAHTRLVLQVCLGSITFGFSVKVHCYLATRPEVHVEVFRDQEFVAS